jgi:hypothetical protein
MYLKRSSCSTYTPDPNDETTIVLAGRYVRAAMHRSIIFRGAGHAGLYRIRCYRCRIRKILTRSNTKLFMGIAFFSTAGERFFYMPEPAVAAG